MVNSSEKDTNRSYYDLNTRKPTMMRNRSRSEHASRTCLPSVLAEEAFYVRHFRYRKRSHSADSAYFDWENRVSPIDSNMYCNGAQLSQDPSSPTQTLFPSEIPMANRITLGLQSVLPGSSAGKLDLHAFIFECFPSKPVDTSKNSLTKYMEEIREYITGNRESSSDHFDLAGDLTSLHEDEKEDGNQWILIYIPVSTPYMVLYRSTFQKARLVRPFADEIAVPDTMEA